jgi:4-diphosphocytidyl-2-C-methyl-D-erythritol kinase
VSAIRVEAHAKLNVFLRVLGRREDGYHDLESLVLPLALHDTLTIREADGLSLIVTGPYASDASDGEQNLVMRAAHALAEATGAIRGAAIQLDKQIPVAAGMGGGSADAAATLWALNERWGTGLGAAALADIGSRVGSDVPALAAGGPVFVAGRGERVSRIEMPLTWWVIRPFPFAVRTPDAFAWWDEDPQTGADPGITLGAAESGHVADLGHALFNDLERPVCAHHPEVGQAIEAFEAAGALGAVVTGSGPTVVALARDDQDAERIAREVPGSFVTHGPPPAADVPRAG